MPDAVPTMYVGQVGTAMTLQPMKNDTGIAKLRSLQQARRIIYGRFP